MKSYKKRAKGGYNTEKSSSNRRERNFEKEEIREELEQVEQGDDFRYRRKGKKTFSSKEKERLHKLTVKIARKEKTLRLFGRHKGKNSWLGRYYESTFQSLKKMRKELEELEGSNEDI